MKHYLLCGLIIVFAFSNAQKQGNVWMFGEQKGLDFNNGVPVLISSQILPLPQPGSMQYIHNEGSASISDSSGSLLFYSEGHHVWNKNHQVMPNGNGLMGFYSSTTAAFIIPKPASDNLFYLFTTDGIERNLVNGLRYNVIDMCLDSGRGDIILNQKNMLLLDSASEKITAVLHPNGRDVWMITHKMFSDAFYSYLITPNGIGNPVVTHVGSVHVGNPSFFGGCGGAIGQMKASPDGKKLAVGFANANPPVTEIFDFNDATGVVSNHLSLPLPSNAMAVYGVEFSPDNSKLYFKGWGTGTWQFNLLAGGGNAASIAASLTSIGGNACEPTGMQLGPDGKIYVIACAGIDVIHNPNAAGPACNYQEDYIVVPNAVGTGNYASGCPQFIAGYKYTNGMPGGFCNYTLLDANVQVTLPTCTNPCSGSATASGAYGTPPYQYLWPALACTTATASNLCPGSYVVRVTDFLGAMVYDTVTINPPVALPTTVIAMDSLVCQGDSSTICALPGYTYLWNTGDTSQCISVYNSGKYFVTVTDENGCTAKASMPVWINSTPSGLITANGTTLNAVSGYNHYQWYNNGIIITGATNSSYNVTQPGSYSVFITDSLGCTTASDEIVLTGLDEFERLQLFIYPNPSTALFNLKITPGNEQQSYILTNSTGRKLKTITITDKGEVLDLTNFENGIYFLQAVPNKKTVYKLVKN